MTCLAVGGHEQRRSYCARKLWGFLAPGAKQHHGEPIEDTETTWQLSGGRAPLCPWSIPKHTCAYVHVLYMSM